MDLDSFSLMLSDSFQVDIYYASWIGGKTFKEASYQNSAVNELYQFVCDKVDSSAYIPIIELIGYVKEFRNKMYIYSKKNKIFTIAKNISEDVLEILHAMKGES